MKIKKYHFYIKKLSERGLRFLFVQLMLILLFNEKTNSQEKKDSIWLYSQIGSMISSHNKSPFWLASNQYGVPSIYGSSLWSQIGISGSGSMKTIQPLYGFDFICTYNSTLKYNIQQAFIGVKYRSIVFKAGKWEERFGNQAEYLSSGGLVWSGNAQPIPKLTLSTNFMKIPFTGGFAEFKGGISHGWFHENQYVSNVFLHHKYVYVKIGGSHKVHLECGLHHFAQWGGKSSVPEYGNIPHDFKSFLKVFAGQGGGSKGPLTETLNAIGNHIGSYDFSIIFDYHKLSTRLYWQTIFEDRSGMRLKNIKDGLWGIDLTFKNTYINQFILEYINTTFQSGRYAAHSTDSTYHDGTGNDNYFNHGVYVGWVNRGMTIGTPLITSPALLSDETGSRIVNNRIKAIHTGLSGKIGILDYLLLYTFSKNYATYSQPFASVKNQHSFMLKASFDDLLPWSIKTTVAVAVDAGDLLGNHTGFLISLRKEGVLSKK